MFQVTNSGDSVIALLRWEVRRGCKPMGTKDVEELSGVVVVLPAVREVVDVEFEEGVEDVLVDEPEREPCDRRCKAGMRGCRRVEEGGLEVVEVGRSSSSEERERLAVSSSSSSRPLG